jgi:hypothetical protein
MLFWSIKLVFVYIYKYYTFSVKKNTTLLHFISTQSIKQVFMQFIHSNVVSFKFMNVVFQRLDFII